MPRVQIRLALCALLAMREEKCAGGDIVTLGPSQREYHTLFSLALRLIVAFERRWKRTSNIRQTSVAANQLAIFRHWIHAQGNLQSKQRKRHPPQLMARGPIYRRLVPSLPDNKYQVICTAETDADDPDTADCQILRRQNRPENFMAECAISWVMCS
ncbi:hypothetical protein GQ43DRAFT_470566 [Delitschia confertaspora ATCC 74209]|uniref:Secreted protein n=1 Tax=Delitschia confertaspora ATCC 74209 TaxID=1513339 RepID=A0A9P4JNI1_9PLEO|nr:hypothetical protein GQ43DRAFT_470566 [Delitschia confertaspora ATCC 74209]